MAKTSHPALQQRGRLGEGAILPSSTHLRRSTRDRKETKHTLKQFLTGKPRTWQSTTSSSKLPPIVILDNAYIEESEADSHDFLSLSDDEDDLGPSTRGSSPLTSIVGSGALSDRSESDAVVSGSGSDGDGDSFQAHGTPLALSEFRDHIHGISLTFPGKLLYWYYPQENLGTTPPGMQEVHVCRRVAGSLLLCVEYIRGERGDTGK